MTTPEPVLPHLVDRVPPRWRGRARQVGLDLRMLVDGLRGRTPRPYETRQGSRFDAWPTARRSAPDSQAAESTPPPTANEAAPTNEASHRVEVLLDDERIEFEVEGDETLLEAGLRQGVDLPFSCTEGGCGACMVRMFDGEVELETPNCLSDDERADGYVLACVSRPRTACRFEVEK